MPDIPYKINIMLEGMILHTKVSTTEAAMDMIRDIGLNGYLNPRIDGSFLFYPPHRIVYVEARKVDD